MTQDVGATLEAILDKLEKLDSIESAVKKIEEIGESNSKVRRLSNNSEERYRRPKRRHQFYGTTTQRAIRLKP